MDLHNIRYLFITLTVFNWTKKNLYLIAVSSFMILYCSGHIAAYEESKIYKHINDHSCLYNATVDRYFEKRKYWKTSNLGTILFKNQHIKYKQQNRIFTVLIWKHPWWNQTFLKNALNLCGVKNCIFTDNDNSIKTVDVVVLSMHATIQIPWVHKRNSSQRWVFLTNESPTHTFANDRDKHYPIENMANVFNRSMAYRSDSDVPIPYGRTVPLHDESRQTNHYEYSYIPYWKSKQRDVLVAAIIHDCSVTKRVQYLNELQKHIKVDLFGNCAKARQKFKKSCNDYTDCPEIRTYFFFIRVAFENSRCRQYITEKVFLSSFANGAIPVVMGAPVSDYERLLPPYSFLHINSFDSPRDLAMEIINISTNDEYIEMYHNWRHYFEIRVANDYSRFWNNSYQLCRLCEALNYNDNKTKIYDLDALKLYLDPILLCT